jgi:hypothetical protein
MIEIRENLPLPAEAKQHCPALPEPALHSFNGHLFVVEIVGTSRQIHLSHPAFANQPQQLVSTDVFAGEIISCRDLLGCVEHRLPEKTNGLTIRLEQGFYLAAQIRIVAARLIEE